MQSKNKIALLLALNFLVFPSCKCSSNNINSNDSEISIIDLKNDSEYKKIELHDEFGNIYEYNSKDDNVVLIKETKVENTDLVESNNESSINKIIKYEMAYVKENTILYDINDFNYLNEIEKYQRVIILEQESDYSLVQVDDNQSAYIENDKIEILPDTFVEVDISDQTMTFYKDGEAILTSNVVTGSNRHKTDLGYTPIYQKLKNIYLTGPTWTSYVNYWMAFNGGIGLHDASWRDEFGGEIYKDNGSHGCVNLPNLVAEELYDLVEIGTMVLVKK